MDSDLPVIKELANQVTRVPFRGKSAPTRAIVRYLLEHVDQPLTLEDVAGHVGLSPNHASTLLKKERGSGFKTPLHELRIQRAIALRLSTSLPVAAVAAQVGFRYPNHFARVFRQRVGLAPQDFRRFVSELTGAAG